MRFLLLFAVAMFGVRRGGVGHREFVPGWVAGPVGAPYVVERAEHTPENENSQEDR